LVTDFFSQKNLLQLFVPSEAKSLSLSGCRLLLRAVAGASSGTRRLPRDELLRCSSTGPAANHRPDGEYIRSILLHQLLRAQCISQS
jgi:hypothetical protein